MGLDVLGWGALSPRSGRPWGIKYGRLPLPLPPVTPDPCCDTIALLLCPHLRREV